MSNIVRASSISSIDELSNIMDGKEWYPDHTFLFSGDDSCDTPLLNVANGIVVCVTAWTLMTTNPDYSVLKPTASSPVSIERVLGISSSQDVENTLRELSIIKNRDATEMVLSPLYKEQIDYVDLQTEKVIISDYNNNMRSFIRSKKRKIRL